MSKTAHIMVRCSPELKKAVRELAEDRSKTATSLVFLALAQLDPKLQEIIVRERV